MPAAFIFNLYFWILRIPKEYSILVIPKEYSILVSTPYLKDSGPFSQWGMHLFEKEAV